MRRFIEIARRSFAEFLGVPTLVIAGFLLLTGIMYWLDHSYLFQGLSAAMGSLVFTAPEATASLLGTLAGSLVTLTSITFSLLLIALQQAAASMTHAIVDQFLRRRSNQIFFGFFVGVALYALSILSATGPAFNPVLSASVALLLGMVSLFLLIVLIYSTIHQMRPAVVIEAIHDQALAAREQQLRMLRRTRRESTRTDEAFAVRADDDGFVVELDLDRIGSVLAGTPDAELELEAQIGVYAAFGDVLAKVRGLTPDEDGQRAIREAFVLERVRDVTRDPGFGIDQLVNIAWTSISTSKQNPAPGRLVILSIRDLLARWSSLETEEPTEDPENTVPVVYFDDIAAGALDAMELLAVVCSESMQAQNVTTILDALAVLHPRMTSGAQARVADVAMRIVAGLGDHVLTAPLERVLGSLADTLATTHPPQAQALRQATETLARSNGRLNSRATRVPAGQAAP